MKVTDRRSRLIAAGMAGLLLASAACSSGSDGSDDADGFETNDVDSATTTLRNIPDVCEVFDPDAVSGQLHIAGYDQEPIHLGMNEGNFPGALKCNFSFDFPEYPDTENWGDLDGQVYMVLTPYNSAEEAAEAYQTLYDGAAEDLRGRHEREQVVDREISGDWDSGAILASVGAGNFTKAMYLKDTYFVLIEIGYAPDPGVEAGLAYKDMDTFEDPTYEFTPPELADWIETEYFPGLAESIANIVEE